MARPKTKGPTDRELAILNILWEQGSCSARDVHDSILQSVKVGYTTVQKMLQIMYDKGLVTRKEARYGHIYQAAEAREKVQKTIIHDVLQKVYHGSATQLVASALSATPASPKEIAQIRKLLDELEDEA